MARLTEAASGGLRWPWSDVAPRPTSLRDVNRVTPSASVLARPIIACGAWVYLCRCGPPPVSGLCFRAMLDFTDISFINSAGLGSCVTVRNDAKPRGADVVL